jgi:mono/diheme cytochrome c family protein
MRAKILAGSAAIILGVIGMSGQAQKSAAPATVTSAAAETAFFTQYCYGCHNQAAKARGVESALRITLDSLDPAHVEKDPEHWEKVVRKLRAGMMPPSGMPRPKPEFLESAIVFVEDNLDRTAKAHLPPPGLHRMNRTEYANAIRDLLDIDIDPSKFLPSDDSTRGFDNIAGALGISPTLLEGYVSAAGKISRLAIGDISTPVQTTYRVAEDTDQDYHVEGMPFGTRGGMIVQHEFPADGEYSMKITPISKGNMGNTNPFGEIPNEKLEVLIDGERLHMFDWDKDREGRGGDGTFDFKFPAKAGRHTVVVTFLATNYAPGNDLDQHFLRSTIETGGLPGYRFFPHVGKFVIDGPYEAKGASDTSARRRIFVCKPASAAQETACARQIITTLGRRAFRRPLTDKDTETLLGFYQRGRNDGTFESGIEMALRRILADPEFVFRRETEPANLAAGQIYRITDLELASRLSFFLWSSIPDDELLKLASQNKLHDNAVLEQQVRRMLKDPRSQQLVSNFAGQWLSLRALQSQTPVPIEYPDFDDVLRQAMRKEVELFVGSVIQEDRPVTDLLDANYTFLNERLAKQYGIPGIYGSNFRRVTLPPEFDMRRGLIGKGAFLTISSNPERTSPVHRGKDTLQIFLGVEPPAPPPNVPALPPQDAAVRGAPRPTMRQQMELHRKNEPCASCHKIMDPIGLTLENFDGTGQWRTLDDGSPIDPSGKLVDGTKLNGIADLRNALVRYSPQFVRVVTEKLMIYALGRGTEYYDMPLVRSIVHSAAKDNYRFSSLVIGVVKSQPFQMNQKLESSGNGQEVASR